MADILQLRDFHVLRLHVDWREGAQAQEQGTEPHVLPSFDYDVYRGVEDVRKFVLHLKYGLEPETREMPGYLVNAEVRGYFEFPESMTEEQMQYLIRVNGGMILYGLLRGALVSYTGSFPKGRLLLPAVDMKEVVEHVERMKEAQKAKPKKKPAKPKVAQKKPATRKKSASKKGASGK